MKYFIYWILIIPWWAVAQDTIYYDQGTVKAKGIIENDLREGKWIFYYPEGQLNAVFQYAEGQLSGIQYYFDWDGDTLAIESWDEDLLEGSSRYFHTNGKLEKFGEYQDGMYEGKWKFYDEEGNKSIRTRLLTEVPNCTQFNITG